MREGTMTAKPLTRDQAREVAQALRDTKGNQVQAAKLLGLNRETFIGRYRSCTVHYGDLEELLDNENPYALQYETPQIGTSASGVSWEFTSDKNNLFKFGAFGDLHAASKYTRWEVREDLTRRAERFGATAILDTGNWIDGEKSFNRYDLEVVGLDRQCQLLAKRYPKTKIPTYAVTGADHEGWYAKSEGIDVGRYCEAIMRDAGHLWTNLGYMEADIVLRNSNNPNATAILRVMHPGGGSSYALSYRPQKIIESFEGGEKPNVLLMGHYHKIDFGLVRNVWYI